MRSSLKFMLVAAVAFWVTALMYRMGKNSQEVLGANTSVSSALERQVQSVNVESDFGVSGLEKAATE